MELCDKQYGFFHLPSLIVLANPYSRFDSVRAFIAASDYSPEKFADVRSKIDADAERDLIQRVTCLHHEVKHFHDLLLTPFGNRLIRSCFKYAMAAALLLGDGKWEAGAYVDLPLRPGSTRTPEAVDRVLRRQNECHQLMESARLTLEASASLAQRQLAWTQFGEAATDTLDEELKANPVYNLLFDVLDPPLHRFLQNNEMGFVLQQIFLLALSGGQSGPDAFIWRLAQRLEKGVPAERFKKAIAEAWVELEKNMQETNEINEKFLADIKALTLPSRLIADILSDAAADFCAKSRLLRSQFLADQTSYLFPGNYLDGVANMVTPLVYFYSVNDELSLSTEQRNIESDNLEVEVVYSKPGSNTKYFSHRLTVADFKLGDISMDRDVWIRFAQSVGGAVALMEEVDWLHPLNARWLRSIEREQRIRFRRNLQMSLANQAGS